jgi:hypothetical protein
VSYTPGPWTWHGDDDQHGDDEGEILAGDGSTVCDFGSSASYDQSSGRPPEPADLALILAAPDLLEACEKFIGLGGIGENPTARMMDYIERYHEVRAVAERAIAKAHGMAGEGAK